MIKDIRAEYAIIRTTDGNYRLGLPHTRSVLPIDVMTIKVFTVEEMVKILGSDQEEVNKELSQYL